MWRDINYTWVNCNQMYRIEINIHLFTMHICCILLSAKVQWLKVFHLDTFQIRRAIFTLLIELGHRANKRCNLQSISSLTAYRAWPFYWHWEPDRHLHQLFTAFRCYWEMPLIQQNMLKLWRVHCIPKGNSWWKTASSILLEVHDSHMHETFLRISCWNPFKIN